MTFWDNPQMVINHIRHSCVTSDDTGKFLSVFKTAFNKKTGKKSFNSVFLIK